NLLQRNTRAKAPLLKYLYRTDWDLVIVDEAHHYGQGNECDSIFATRYSGHGLGRGDVPDFGPGLGHPLHYRYILLLTATPFELQPSEMLNLLRIVGACAEDIEQIRKLLKDYEQRLKELYG